MSTEANQIIPIIEIEIQERKRAKEINSPHAGKYYLVDEMELGTGIHKKAVAYTEGALKKGVQCRAIILSPGRVRIIL